MSGRRGFTLVELLVGMVILGIIGAALTGLFVSQSRFYDQQAQLRRARFVSRTAINAALSDLRMVEATGGIVSATATNVTVLPQGRVVSVQPPLPASLPAVTAVGTPVFLIQRMTYEFKPSVALPGRTALWRTIVATGQADELVAPFDSAAKFRFFVVGSDTAQSPVPNPLTNMRGVELDLMSQSDRAPQATAAPKQAQAVTAVFFNNQLK